MKYGWGVWGVLSLAIVAGCGGGTTGDGDTGGIDSATLADGGHDGGTPLDGAGRDASIDAFAGGSDTGAGDAGLDAARIDDAGNDAFVAHDANHDTSVSVLDANLPDSGCAELQAAIGMPCTPATGCPEGFTCYAMPGFALQYQCEILCGTGTSACPCGTTCTPQHAKGVSWMQCE